MHLLFMVQLAKEYIAYTLKKDAIKQYNKECKENKNGKN